MARSRRLDLAEDALSEAFARAAARWETDGVPDNPTAWLYTVAWRHLLMVLRAEAVRGRKLPLLAVGWDWTQDQPEPDAASALGDERLALILLCCHPALSEATRSPLALRLVVGTSTAEIARLFLVPTATMAARITRAKQKIVGAGIPLRRPVDEELRRRLDDVCRTIYLAFTAGYTPGSGPDLLRADLAGDAVELASILHRLVPRASQVQALLGLLLLQHARRDSRVSTGKLVTLDNQDRTRWRHDEIEVGTRLIQDLTPQTGFAETLRLQGLIAIEHGRAAEAVDTRWGHIAATYQQLEMLTASPVVRLNRAVAVAEADGAEAGLRLLADLELVLSNSHRLHAVRAELAHRLGDVALARSAYERALATCGNEVERRHLQDRLAELGARPS